jgi:1-acyl-sn-glycerol-3-phosphate acyltransferase
VVRSLVFCAVQAPLAILATGVLSLVACLVGPIWPGSVRALSVFWGRLLLRLFRVGVTSEGLANLPAGQAVYAANHSSSLDILVVLAHLPVDVKIIYKKSLSRVPLLGWSIVLGGHIPIDRSNPFRARRSLDSAAERIRGGTSVLVFPEGTRSRDGTVGHFKRGSFSLAIEAAAPVVPVSFVGVKALVPRGLFSMRPGSVRLRVHPAVSVAGRSAAAAQALAEEVRQVVAAGCERVTGDGGRT